MKNNAFNVAIKRNRGFTLVETLVVVGVLAVLCALLFPALTLARNTARTAQCCSNQRQLMQAFTIFCIQNNGKVPPYVNTNVSGVYWADDMQWIIDPRNPNYRICPATDPPDFTDYPVFSGASALNQYGGVYNGVSSQSSYGFNLQVDSNVPSACGVNAAGQVRTLVQTQPVVVIADCTWPGFKGDSATANGQLIQPPTSTLLGYYTNSSGNYIDPNDGSAAGHWDQFLSRCFLDRHQGRIVVGMSDGAAMPIKLRDLWGGVRMNAQGIDRRSLVTFPAGY